MRDYLQHLLTLLTRPCVKGTKAELIARLTSSSPAPKEAVAEAATSVAPDTVDSTPSKAESSPAPAPAPAQASSSSSSLTPATPVPSETPAPAPKAAHARTSVDDSESAEPAAKKQDRKADESADAELAKKPAALAPRPAPRLVPASINSGEAPVSSSTSASSSVTPMEVIERAPTRELTVRKRKVTEVEEPRQVKAIPSTKPASEVIKITNLVRPFTLPALKELLEKSGPLVRFWMDTYKTSCVVAYSSIEEATATRNAMHGTTWPSFNTKKLVVEFATQAELDALLGKPTAQKTETKHVAEESAKRMLLLLLLFSDLLSSKEAISG